MMEYTQMAHRLRHRIGRLEQGSQQQRVIVMSVAFAEQDCDDLVDEALAAAGVVRGPNDLLVKTLSYFTKPGDPPARLVSVAPTPGGH